MKSDNEKDKTIPLTDTAEKKPPFNPFKKKVRVIPESYIHEPAAKTIVNAEKKELTIEEARNLVKTQRFIYLIFGFVPSAFYLVNLLGLIISGFKMEEPSTNVPFLAVLSVCFVMYFISTIWELQGGVALIVASLLLGFYDYNMVSKFIFGEMILYPIPFLISGIVAILYYVNKQKLKIRIRNMKKICEIT